MHAQYSIANLIMFNKSSIIAATSAAIASACLLMCVESATAQSAPIQDKTTYVGPSIGFGSGVTVYGVNGKFKVADSISVRPFVQFGSVSGINITYYGASATYDFSLPQSEFQPYAGVGYLGATASASFAGTSVSASTSGIYFEVGSDYNISDSIALNANYKFRDSGYFSLGGGYRF